VYEEKLASDFMIKSIKERTGKSHLVFIVSGVVICPGQFLSAKIPIKLRLQKGW